MKSIEKYKKDGATILTWTNDGKNEIDYAKMEGGHILIKLNKLTTPGTDIGQCFLILDYMVV